MTSVQPPSASTHPDSTRPLPLRVTVPFFAAIAALLVVYVRASRGSWSEAGATLLRGGLLLGSLWAVLWAFFAVERRRGRAYPTWVAVGGSALLGAAAGAVASALVPSPDRFPDGLLFGAFWGTLIGISRVRDRAAK